MFAILSEQDPGKVIVEKTPIHLLHADRIRRIFPRAKTLLVLRDGRAAVASWLAIRRSAGRWRRRAPAEVSKATEMWKRYAEVALKERTKSSIVRYEDLLVTPEDQLSTLLRELGLETRFVKEQVARSHGGRNIERASETVGRSS